MKKIFTLPINDQINKIMNETYNTMLAAVKSKDPKIEQLIDDEEISSLHDMIPLLRLGHVKVYHDEYGENICIEILEK